MAATVRLDIFQGIEAIIDNYRWTSSNKGIARILNNSLSPDGPESYDPNPDYTAAQEAVKRFGGKIVSFDKSRFDPKVVY